MKINLYVTYSHLITFFEFFTRASLSVHFKILWEKHLFLNCCGYPMSQSNLNMLHLRKRKKNEVYQALWIRFRGGFRTLLDIYDGAFLQK